MCLDVTEILQKAIKNESSDLFIVAGLPLTYKCHGVQVREDKLLYKDDIEIILTGIYELAGRSMDKIKSQDADDDFSFALNGIGRFRVNVFHQRGTLAAVLRVIRFGIPSYKDIGIPEEVMKVADFNQGIVLVTGQVGCGKSTTLACIIDAINHTRSGHILTLEDPLEYIHRHDKCIVSQREIFNDSPSYISALRSALRESPDVILLGEMRDAETIEVAMTAAETGQLLFSSLHTIGAANSINRIVDVFPADQQAQIRQQLSMTLQAVISQQLVPDVNGNLIPAFEIMKCNTAIRSLIRQNNTHQINSVIQDCADEGMCLMDTSLLRLYASGKISRETVLNYCQDHESTSLSLKTLG